VIELLLPAGACVEMFHDVPESTMFSTEAAVVKGAVAKRCRESATSRYCSRKALQKIGAPAVPVLSARFALTSRWLDFVDVSMTAHLDGSFRARFRVPSACGAGVSLDRFNGQWMVDRGLVIAATSVSQARAARTPTHAGAT
jgi:4'-phosphopantetheinyl transferase EntD